MGELALVEAGLFSLIATITGMAVSGPSCFTALLFMRHCLAYIGMSMLLEHSAKNCVGCNTSPWLSHFNTVL